MFSYNTLFPFFQPSIIITPEVSDYWSPTVISLTWPPLIPSSPNPILIFLTAKWSNPVVPHCGILSPLQADLYVICVVAVPGVWFFSAPGSPVCIICVVALLSSVWSIAVVSSLANQKLIVPVRDHGKQVFWLFFLWNEVLDYLGHRLT